MSHPLNETLQAVKVAGQMCEIVAVAVQLGIDIDNCTTPYQEVKILDAFIETHKDDERYIDVLKNIEEIKDEAKKEIEVLERNEQINRLNP